MRRLADLIVNGNRAYDGLADTRPTLRFLLFITPPCLATLADAVLAFSGFRHVAVVFYITLVLMFAWRAVGLNGQR